MDGKSAIHGYLVNVKDYLQQSWALTAVVFALLALAMVACGADVGPTGERPTETLPPAPAQVQETLTSPTLLPTRMPTATPTPSRQPTLSPQSVPGTNSVFIQLTDPLDEPEYYCVDVPAAGRGVRLESDLHAHTCKPVSQAEDELFTLGQPNDGQIYMEAYDLCVEAAGAMAGTSLQLQPCSDSPLQLFVSDQDQIRLDVAEADGLCLAVAPGFGTPTGGPSHLRRGLTLEKCETAEPTLARWSLGLFDY